MTEPTLQSLIDKFLSERRESSGGWAPVHTQDLYLLHGIIFELICAKWGADPDGAFPIECDIVDRTERERSSYLAVPYLHSGDLDDAEKVQRHEDAIVANLEMAVGRFTLYRRCTRRNK